MIGKKLSPILEEIEKKLLEHSAKNRGKPNFTKDGFRAASMIFMEAMMDKMFELQLEEKMIEINCCNMAEKLGEDLRNLIKTYTNIDSFDFYK